MTKKELIEIAKKQLALDFNCNVTDFNNNKNIFNTNTLIDGRRIYRNDGCFFKLLAINGIAVFSADEKIMHWLKENFQSYEGEWIFEYQTLKSIDKKLMEFNHEISSTHHYYLPNPKFSKVESKFDIKWFEKDELFRFKGDKRFSEALAFSETHPDVLAIIAMDGDKIMGMAGASEDSKTMWQIGIDVIAEYRGIGVATNLVSLLKEEILKRGKVPFYGTAESHNFSKQVALNSGFFPFWAEAASRKCK